MTSEALMQAVLNIPCQPQALCKTNSDFRLGFNVGLHAACELIAEHAASVPSGPTINRDVALRLKLTIECGEQLDAESVNELLELLSAVLQLEVPALPQKGE